MKLKKQVFNKLAKDIQSEENYTLAIETNWELKEDNLAQCEVVAFLTNL